MYTSSFAPCKNTQRMLTVHALKKRPAVYSNMFWYCFSLQHSQNQALICAWCYWSEKFLKCCPCCAGVQSCHWTVSFLTDLVLLVIWLVKHSRQLSSLRATSLEDVSGAHCGRLGTQPAPQIWLCPLSEFKCGLKTLEQFSLSFMAKYCMLADAPFWGFKSSHH